MKDPVDTVTAELNLPVRRGRPATGTAKTAAQRKREQRERDRRAFSASFSAGTLDLSQMTVGSLCEGLARYVSLGSGSLAGAFMKELARRVNQADATRSAAEPPEWQFATTVTVTVDTVGPPSSVTVTKKQPAKVQAYADTNGLPPESVTVTENDSGEAKSVTVTKKRLPPKYRYALTGETWSGRGKKPRWLEVFLERGGSLDDLLL